MCSTWFCDCCYCFCCYCCWYCFLEESLIWIAFYTVDSRKSWWWEQDTWIYYVQYLWGNNRRRVWRSWLDWKYDKNDEKEIIFIMLLLTSSGYPTTANQEKTAAHDTWYHDKIRRAHSSIIWVWLPCFLVKFFSILMGVDLTRMSIRSHSTRHLPLPGFFWTN